MYLFFYWLPASQKSKIGSFENSLSAVMGKLLDEKTTDDKQLSNTLLHQVGGHVMCRGYGQFALELAKLYC